MRRHSIVAKLRLHQVQNLKNNLLEEGVLQVDNKVRLWYTVRKVFHVMALLNDDDHDKLSLQLQYRRHGRLECEHKQLHYWFACLFWWWWQATCIQTYIQHHFVANEMHGNLEPALLRDMERASW